MLIGSLLDMPERAGHIIVFSSVPLFLLTGAAWPHQAMPEWFAMVCLVFTLYTRRTDVCTT